jgi:thiol-disulfide isomerase/thioredoxin
LRIGGWIAACVAFGALVTPACPEDRANPTLAPGSIPENDLGRDIEGNRIRLSDYPGQVVIVSFWASWCGPCRKELPVLASVAKKVGSDQLKIIAINFRDEPKPFKFVVDVLKDYPITILRDNGGRTARKYRVQSIPRMIIVGRDGKVAADHTGYAEGALPALIEELNVVLAKQTT